MNTEIKLDPIVDAFDQQWQAGTRPQLTGYLERVSDSQRNQLAKLLIPIDVEYRRKAGDSINSTSDYGYLGREIIELADSVARGDASRLDQRHTNTSSIAYDQSVHDTVTHHAEHQRMPVRVTSEGCNQDKQEPGQFGDYQVLNKIAEHGQGIVFRANHPRLHRQVVIKVCKWSDSASNRQALLDEAKVLAQLSHPNVATVYDVQFDKDDDPYLVMEYIEGRNLADAIRESRPSVAEAVAITKAVCDGLQHAHSFGILHLDLKPTNIVIRGSDRVPKIIDFGLAQLKPAYATAESSSYGGTFRYMAPEQANSMKTRDLYELGRSSEKPQPLDARADVFAVGAMLYELLTGKQLRLTGDSKNQEMEDAIANNYDAAPLSQPGVPKQLAVLCQRALATNPEDRIGTVAEFASLLTQETDPPKTTSQRGLLVGGVLLGCAALLGIPLIVITFLKNGSTTQDQQAPTGAVVPLETKPLDPVDLSVQLFTRRSVDELQPEGVMGADHRIATQGQFVRVDTTLPSPCYCYLIALNPTEDPEWNIQLCYPENADTPPELLTTLSYPLKKTSFTELSDGIGQQAFVLITSPEPLKPFREWKAAVGERLKWPVNDTLGVWKYQKSEIKPLYVDKSQDRGPTKDIAPKQFTALLENLTKALSNTNEEITAFAFPVLPAGQ